MTQTILDAQSPGDIKADAWQNIMTGLGRRGQDKSAHLEYGPAPILRDIELANLYDGEGIASRIVDLKPEDATKNGFEVLGDEDSELYPRLTRLNVQTTISRALKWARLFGGALMLIDVENSGDLDKPLVLSKNRTIRKIRVYSRARVYFEQTDFSKDASSPYFEHPEYYTIYKRWGGQFRVHASRCIPVYGIPSADVIQSEDFFTTYWGNSIIRRVYSHLGNLGAMLAGLGIMGQEFSIGKLKLSNLSRLVAENNWGAIDKRMEAIALQKSITKTILLGEGEDYNRDNLGGTGLDTITDKLFQAVATASGYPVSILFARPGGGLNANQEEDTRRYYDGVTVLQANECHDILYRLAEIENAGLGFPVPVDDLDVKWDAPWVMSETETLANREKQMNIDRGYIELGVYTANDAAKRFVGGYTYETSIEGLE